MGKITGVARHSYIEFEGTGILVKKSIEADGQVDVWLTPDVMSEIFKKDVSAISKNIARAYKEDKLSDSTYREFVVITEKNWKKYKSKKKEYNLDVILSVGYRTNGEAGTRFRKWANKVLGEYLRQGYVVNEKVMLERGMWEVLGFMENFQKRLAAGKGDMDEVNEVLNVIRDYGYSLTTLQKYDEWRLVLEWAEKNTAYVLDYDSSIRYISKLKEELIKKGEAKEKFWRELTHRSLAGILGNVFNGMFWSDVYPSLEEKASHLLYFIVKDHPFHDGNKRIASFLFSLFLSKNNFQRKSNGELKINDNALAILVIMIAESNPREKDQYIKLLVNILRTR